VNFGAGRYRMGSGAKCESSNPVGSSDSQEEAIAGAVLLEVRIAPTKVRSTLILGEVIKQRKRQAWAREVERLPDDLLPTGIRPVGERAHERGRYNDSVVLIQ
jgi:hypothetical protein